MYNKPLITVFSAIAISQIVLFFLKAFNVVSFGWGWVFAPLWIPYACLLLAAVIIALYMFITNKRKEKQQKGG